jgi:PmbA protein
VDHKKFFNELSDKIINELKMRGGDSYEIYYQAARSLSIEAEGGEVEDFKFSEPYGVGIRVITGHGMGFSFSTYPDDDAIGIMVENAISSAKNSTPDENYTFAPPPDKIPDAEKIYDETIEKIPLDEKIGRAMAIEEGAMSVNSRVKRVRNARYSEVTADIFIKNSLGVDVAFKKSVVSAQVMAMAVSSLSDLTAKDIAYFGDRKGGEQEMGWDYDFSTMYAELDPKAVGRRAGELAVSILGAKKAPTGKFIAILTPNVASDLLEVLSSSLLGENVLKGKSMLLGKEGKKIFSSKITILDDGLFPGGIGTSPVDGEGVPKRQVELIKDGELICFLYDLLNAKRANKNSTGSAERGGVTAPPTSGVNNLYIVPGEKTESDLLEEAKDGVIITELMGAHTINPVTGEFSVGASGFVFEGGVKKYSIKEAALAGDLISLFSKVSLVGSDLRFFGSVGSPSILIEEIELSGK